MGISSAGSCRGCACARSLPARRWRSTAPTLQRGQPGATFCMMAWKAVAATVLIAAALRPSSAWAGAEGSPTLVTYVTYRSDQVSVHLVKAPLEDVLAELGRVSGAEIQGAPRESRDITAQFDEVPLAEALHRFTRRSELHAHVWRGEPAA